MKPEKKIDIVWNTFIVGLSLFLIYITVDYVIKTPF